MKFLGRKVIYGVNKYLVITTTKINVILKSKEQRPEGGEKGADLLRLLGTVCALL